MPNIVKMSAESSNRRVAKNTLILYVRMFITMAIGMWTSRIVLNALGFTDQGLYNLVGGFVGFLSIITSSIKSAFSRFLTYEIGRGNNEELNRIFRNATMVQWVLVLIVLLLAETIGLWFVCNKMVIPPDRMQAVLIVYHLSVALFAVELLSTAQSALVIAYEKMNVFAGVSIATSVGKFVIALVIAYSASDRLILYAILLALLSVGTRIFYAVYCRCAFPFIKLSASFDKEIFVSVFSFAGWSSITSSAHILRTSGTGVLLNLFGGPIANTINGIANSVSALITIFVNDFATAYNPQIIKSYAAKKSEDLITLLYRCSKFTYCVLLIVAVPVMVNVEPLLVLWLKKIPEHTVVFARLIIVYSLIECICIPLITAKNAAGNIRSYQIIVGGVVLMTLPISYLFLKLGFPLWITYVSMIFTSCVAFVFRMIVLKDSIPEWSSRNFFSTIILNCVITTIVSFTIPILLYYILPNKMLSVLVQCLVAVGWCCLCVYVIACNAEERRGLRNLALRFFDRFKG